MSNENATAPAFN